MIALNKDLLKNTFFIEGAKSLKEAGFITTAQFMSAKVKTPVLKTQSNFLVRLGFLVLGILLYSSIVGVISLFGLTIIEGYFEWVTFLYAIVGLVGIEFLSKQNYFGYGLDDAFVLGFQSMLCLAIGINTESPTAAFLTMAIAGIFCCIRYVNTVSALLAVIGITGFFCCLVFDLKLFPELYLPFIGFLLAIVFYAIYYRLKKMPEMYFYQYALQVVQIFSLVLGYASINYFVVRELSVELMGIVVTPGHDIPFAAVFYALTFAVPVFYLVYALKQKSRELFVIGLLCLGCSVLTIRYYYSILPPETALMLCGLILFGAAYFCIKKLKHKESGITFERDRYSDKNTLLYAQALIVNSQISVKPTATDTGDMPFGGGGFSGGGGGGNF